MGRLDLTTLGRAALPIVALLVFVLGVGATIAAAGSTLGYDYQAYVGAADRLLHGRPLYDLTVEVAGPFAIYLYPPPFAIAFVPFALLQANAGLWLWIGLCVAMTVWAIALLPVSPATRWIVLLLAGLDWPVVYAIKLGQVGPLLLLLAVLGWRWLQRPEPLGVIGAIGALVKVQPGLLLVWAVLTRRWRTVAAGSVTLVVAGLVSVLILGTGTWFDYVTLLGRVSAPVTTPHNVTLGAVAFAAGLPVGAATVVQGAALVATVGLWLAAVARRRPETSYVATIIASQLLSPLLWEHYAMLLLLPVAWLLAQGRRWAVLIPLATAWPLLGIIPAVAYPAVFLLTLAAVVLLRPRPPRPSITPADPHPPGPVVAAA